MSDDPKFDKEQYERWRTTPYSKPVLRPKKKDSNIGIPLLILGAAAVGGLVAARFRKGKQVAEAAKKATAVVTSGSKTIPKGIPSESTEDLVKHQYPGRSTFDQINEDLSKLEYPKSNVPSKNTFDQINEDLSKLDYSGTSGIGAEDVYPSLIRQGMQTAFKQRLGKAARGSVPKAVSSVVKPKGSAAKIKTAAGQPVVKSIVKKTQGSTARIKAAAKQLSVQPSVVTVKEAAKQVTTKPAAITAVKFKTTTPAAPAASKVPAVKDVKTVVDPAQSSIEQEIIKLKAENEALKTKSLAPKVTIAPPVIAKDLNPDVAKAYKRNARLEKRLALRAKALELKTSKGAPAPKTLEDLATDFLKKKGISETGQPLDELVHDPEFEAIRQASRGGLTDDDMTEWGFQSEKRTLEALRSVGGRKSSFADLIKQGVIPKSTYDPEAVAKKSIKYAKKGDK